MTSLTYTPNIPLQTEGLYQMSGVLGQKLVFVRPKVMLKGDVRSELRTLL